MALIHENVLHPQVGQSQLLLLQVAVGMLGSCAEDIISFKGLSLWPAPLAVPSTPIALEC